MKQTFYQKHKTLIFSLLGVVGFFVAWLVTSLIFHTTLYPTPIATFKTLFSLLGQVTTYQAVGTTILSLLISLTISFLVGALFGVLGGVFEAFRAFFKPFVTVMKAIPTAAIVFFIIVFTKPMFASIIVTSIITFPLVYEAFVSGFTSINQDILDSLDVDGSNFFKRVFVIYLPLSYKHILLSLTQVIGLGMKVSIMAEVLTSTGTFISLGSKIQQEAAFANMNEIFAYSFIGVSIILLSDLGLYFVRKKLKKEITE